MIRMLNFFCVALAGLACLALYRVSEQTRIANAELHKVRHAIVAEHGAMHVLEADWQSVASPDRIQRLAESRLGIADTTTIQLSAFSELPRQGEDAPLNNTRIQQASVQVVAPAASSTPEAVAPTAAPQSDTAPGQ